ncbi:MAG: glycosyltransferase family 1 protein [Lachnospiraceae bacterium]|nr:glycosyltransferase family 1 protein [Lachnospiraceae bacterium]
MSETIRILHVLGGTALGGAESRIMDLYRQMDRNEIQFDFLVHSNAIKHPSDDASAREPQFYDEEIKALGGNIYVLPKFKIYNYFTYRKAIRAFFAKHHEFRVVQGHMTSTAAIYLPIAKKNGIPITVAHSRSAGVDKGLKGIATKILRKNLYKKTDYCFACSELAGINAFGRKQLEKGKVKIIYNAIDAAKFSYSPEKREFVRKQLKIEDKLVLGHVGRFSTPKNHPYLIEIFAALCGMRDDAVLVLLGDGPDRDKIELKCEELGIRDKVLFMGNCKQPEDYYQAFDIFLLPSLYEGLPGVLVEAQAAGLRCIVSDTVTREARATDLVTYMDIKQPASVWAKEIVAQLDYDRCVTFEEIAEKGLDIKKQALAYREFYLNGDSSKL